MTDRAREGLFSSIAADLPDARVLDLFAGSGSLGLEALSRGAREVVFVERERAALSALEANIDAVGLGGRIVAADVRRHLSRPAPAEAFDVAFVDPPYAASLPSVVEVLDELLPWLSPGALVVVHRRAGEDRPTVQGLEPVGERAYGTAQLWRYRRTVDDPGSLERPVDGPLDSPVDRPAGEDRIDERSEERG